MLDKISFNPKYPISFDLKPTTNTNSFKVSKHIPVTELSLSFIENLIGK